MPRKLPKIISKEDYKKLREGCMKAKKIKKSILKQYQLAIILAAEAGLRISEIVGYIDRVPILDKKNIDLQANKIFVSSGKGEKDRIVPVPTRITAKHLKLFPLTIKRRALQHFITKLAKDLIEKDISFHSLRHFFGTCCADGMSLHKVQVLMGHSRLDTTGIYLHANPTKAVEEARRVDFG